MNSNRAHAHWDQAHMLFEGKKDYTAVVQALEGFLALVPTGEDAERARSMLAETRRQVGQGARRGSAPAPAAAAMGPERAARSSVVPADATVSDIRSGPLSRVPFTAKAAQSYQVTDAAHGRRG